MEWEQVSGPYASSKWLTVVLGEAKAGRGGYRAGDRCPMGTGVPTVQAMTARRELSGAFLWGLPRAAVT